MSRRCTICDHSDRQAIEAAVAAGGSIRGVAGQFAVGRTALARHTDDHVPQVLVAQKQAIEVIDFSSGSAVLDEVARLRAEAKKLGERAAAQGDMRTALAAVREQTRIVELLAQLAEQAAKNKPPDGDDIGLDGLTEAQLEALAELPDPVSPPLALAPGLANPGGNSISAEVVAAPASSPAECDRGD